MRHPTKSLLFASLLFGVVLSPANAAEREDVRKVMNLARNAGAKGISLGVEEIKK